MCFVLEEPQSNIGHPLNCSKGREINLGHLIPEPIFKYHTF